MGHERYWLGFPASKADLKAFGDDVVRFMTCPPAGQSGTKLAYDYLYGIFTRNAAKTAALLSTVGIFTAVAFIVFQRVGPTWSICACIASLAAAAFILIFNQSTVWWTREPVPLPNIRAYKAFVRKLCKLARNRVRNLFIAQVLFAAALLFLAIDLVGLLLAANPQSAD